MYVGMIFCTHKFIEISCTSLLSVVMPAPHSFTLSHSSPSDWGDSWLQECQSIPTVPNDCAHKKGFNSLSQLSPHTLACKGREKNSTRLLNLLPLHHLATLNHDPPPPSSVAPTFLLTLAACIKDPSEVSLATFTSERGSIMERLGRRMRRQRGTHRCGGGRGGRRKEQRPIVVPTIVITRI